MPPSRLLSKPLMQGSGSKQLKQNSTALLANHTLDLVQAVTRSSASFSRQEGVDYGETFAPVAKFGSVRTVLAIAAIEDMELEQMNAVTAFLNPDIDEEIYMEQPEGFAIAGQEDLVCRLCCSLYGLKQSSRNWNELFAARLKQLGFVQSNADSCIYTLHARDPKSILYLVVYVDNIEIHVQDDRHGRSGLFLRVEITRDCPSRRLWLSQKHYLQKMLVSFGMDNCKPVSTPMETSTCLTKAMEPQSDEERAQMVSTPYLSAVGSLCRLDLAASDGSVSQFMANPWLGHWQAVKRILRYVSGTLDAVLGLGGSFSMAADLEGYSDTDWAGCPDSRCSTTGFVFMWRPCSLAKQAPAHSGSVQH
ncbi:DNA-directed DNA polymerase [Powellomyces hirtus]|uniref:DNA-directed DNA polymerase n=1 Tax=Powellomyces hirtus TaxID=109895 RepID=A0A507DPV0_9FUNG|nr:DNA-directed DNA polymerase [Powellomyces hirtus]